MTTPVGPKDFPLSRDWWLSGSAWHTKTADDVWKVLRVERESGERRNEPCEPITQSTPTG